MTTNMNIIITITTTNLTMVEVGGVGEDEAAEAAEAAAEGICRPKVRRANDTTKSTIIMIITKDQKIIRLD